MNIEGTPVITQGKTAYYVSVDGEEIHVTGPTGRRHGWFSLPVARQLAREVGGWYEQGNRTTVKDVVTYLARSGAPSIGPASERPSPKVRELEAQLEALGDWRAQLDGELAQMAEQTRRINRLARSGAPSVGRP